MILIDIGEAEDEEYTAGIYMNEQGKSLMYPPVRGGLTYLKEADGLMGMCRWMGSHF